MLSRMGVLLPDPWPVGGLAAVGGLRAPGAGPIGMVVVLGKGRQELADDLGVFCGHFTPR